MKRPLPPQVQKMIMNAFALRDQGRWYECRQQAEAVLKIHAREPHCLYLLGSLALEEGDLAAAEALFQKGVESDKKGHMNQSGVGLVMLRRGKASEAQRWLKLAHKTCSGGTLRICVTWLSRNSAAGQQELALTQFRKVLDLAPDYLPGLRHLSRMLTGRGDYPAAVKLLDRGLQKFPNDLALLEKCGPSAQHAG